MKSFLVLATGVFLVSQVSGFWDWGKRYRNRHHSVSQVSTSFSNTNCDCGPKNFTSDIFRRALDTNGDGDVSEREAATVLDQMDDAPSLEDLRDMISLERRHPNSHSHVSRKGCCVSTVHHSFIDNNHDGEVDKREAARILKLEEDHPGLSLFMHHADMKRDGIVDVGEFRDAVNKLQFCKF